MLLNPVYQVLTRRYIVAFFVFFLFPAALIIVLPQIYVLIHVFKLTGRVIVSKSVSVNYIGPHPWNEGCPQPPAVPSVISGRSGG